MAAIVQSIRSKIIVPLWPTFYKTGIFYTLN